jgi:ribonuclease BN (tRNA processing enzyme)
VGGHRIKRIRTLLTAFLLLHGFGTALAACTGSGIEVQVLGSGGPELQDARASSSYLIWRDGKARVLIDSGGGSALRFVQSGAVMTDLDLVLFTHLHIDHTADFAALIKSSYFEERRAPLPVYGPSGNADFPSLGMWIADLFDPKRGAYRYLGTFLKGRQEGYVLQPHTIILAPREMRVVSSADGIVVRAARVVHGDVPALAWRIEIGGRVIAFSGDGDGRNGNLQRVAHAADVFIAHNAVPEGAEGAPLALHMPPSLIGQIAAQSGVKHLVLSHRMLRTLGRESETAQMIARRYAGPLDFANDLDCYH